MRQAVDAACKEERRKIGEKALRSIKQQTRLMRVIIARMVNGEIDCQSGGTIIRAIDRLRLATASGEVMDRVEHLEEVMGVARAPGVRHGEDDGDGAYADGYDDDARPGVH